MFCAKPTRSFSRRVFKVFMLSLLAVSAIFTGSSLYAQKQHLEAGLLDRGLTLAGLLASGAKTAAYSENAALVQDTLQGVLERREVLAAAVFTRDRTPLAVTARSSALRERAGTLTVAETELSGSPQLRTGCVSLQEEGHVDIFCPVLIRIRVVPGQDLYFEDPPAATSEEFVGFVKLTLDRGPLLRESAALLLRSLLLVLLLLLAGTGAVFLISRRVTEPLERLTEAVRSFGAGSGIREIPRTSNDEIGRLAEAFTTMIRDLSDRDREKERLAERLREAQKMEAVGTLSQGISHDFKNILSTLKAAVHILQKGSPDNEFVMKYTGKIQTTLDRARDLVERLVTFSRTRELHASPVDLSALLARLAPMLRETIGEKVRLNLEPAPAPVRVLGDEVSLEQLLVNLAYNARDAMPEGGILCMRVEAVAGATADRRGTARITVRDTGIGMNPEVRRRLFEPFFTTKGVGAGMGLGLSIVHGIVEQHHGRIEVDSEPGEGATFRVDLPLLGDETPIPQAGEESAVVPRASVVAAGSEQMR